VFDFDDVICGSCVAGTVVEIEIDSESPQCCDSSVYMVVAWGVVEGFHGFIERRGE
jgi:hypothetical protein